MTIFKNYFKILKKNKTIIFIYVGILLLFSTLSLQSSDMATSFSAIKPNVTIINNDTNSITVDNLISYIGKNANIIQLKNDKDTLDDALFYREVNYIIYIPENYSKDFLNNKNPIIETKKTTDYVASYMEMLLQRYLKIADIYASTGMSETEIINNINSTLKKQTTIEVSNTLNTSALGNASFYYNFANYTILAICIYIVGLLMNKFNESKVKKRNLISSTPISSMNRQLYLANFIFVLAVWLFVVILSIITVGDIMFTTNGLWLILNSLVFAICALSIGFLFGNIIKKKEALTAIVNVIALGSSFLCGCFVPASYLPQSVLNIAKFLPSYWFIQNNDFIKTVETFNASAIRSILFNMGIVLAFAIIYYLITLMYSKYSRKTS